jgi:hypothetical protein
MMQSFDPNKALVATHDLTQNTHNEHLSVTRDWVMLFGAIGAVAFVLVTALGLAATASAPMWLVLPLLVGFGFSCVLALVALRALEYARYSIHARLEQWVENQIAAREIAKMQAAQITQVSVKGRSNVVSVNSAGAGVESVRLVGVNVNRPARMVDGVDERDLIFFCERVPVIGHTKRVWLGATLPSGKQVSTFQDYDALILPLLKAGVLVGRGERTAGKLVTYDASELKRALGLPSGAQSQNQIAQTIEGTAQEIG